MQLKLATQLSSWVIHAFYEPLSVATDKGNSDAELDAEIARIITEMQKDYTLTMLVNEVV